MDGRRVLAGGVKAAVLVADDKRVQPWIKHEVEPVKIAAIGGEHFVEAGRAVVHPQHGMAAR